MASQIERVTQALRRCIFSGQLAPGERLVELQWAATLQVSRTPLRIALGELEKQGLLERLPKRGFRVRAFTMEAISDAIDVRGALEGLAAERLAEKGVAAEPLATLQACLTEGRALVEAARADGLRLDAAGWIAMNARFHACLVEAAGNQMLSDALEMVSKTPMAGAASLGLDGALPVLEFALIARAQEDHEDIVRALGRREGSRAASLMREHARRSRDNKQAILLRRQNP
ncbi:GntR family transcriptional regulator [Variovorax sp. HJSM1_2]|uniref:GntR family transcriptional regulator n=1 Tax=Variovorax sp. HJSM1_2 TaxID=3366263 RepID=UPI003BE7DADA